MAQDRPFYELISDMEKIMLAGGSSLQGIILSIVAQITVLEEAPDLSLLGSTKAGQAIGSAGLLKDLQAQLVGSPAELF